MAVREQPLLSSGVGGYSKDTNLNCMKKVVCRFLARYHKAGYTDGKALNSVTVTNNKLFSVKLQNLISVTV